jgi:hypothetical protein
MIPLLLAVAALVLLKSTSSAAKTTTPASSTPAPDEAAPPAAQGAGLTPPPGEPLQQTTRLQRLLLPRGPKPRQIATFADADQDGTGLEQQYDVGVGPNLPPPPAPPSPETLPIFTDRGTVAPGSPDPADAGLVGQLDKLIMKEIPVAGQAFAVFNAVVGNGNAAGLSPQQLAWLQAQAKTDVQLKSTGVSTAATLRTAALEGRDASKVLGDDRNLNAGGSGDGARRVGGGMRLTADNGDEP